MDTDEIDVVLGVNDLSSSKGERIEVDNVIIHDDYDPNTSDNDIALLILKEPSKQQPIEIIQQDDPKDITAPGTMTVVTGWGLLREGGQSSDILMEVKIPIVSNDVANDGYGQFGAVVTDNMLAAGFEEGGKDACQGDSGGPLMVKGGNGRLVLAGATSWGIGCARPHLPGIYARISNYSNWIKSHIS
jgi:secreted trypsin-like serine protease